MATVSKPRFSSSRQSADNSLPYRSPRRSKPAERRKGQAGMALWFLGLCVSLLFFYIVKVFIPPAIEARSAILIHAETGRVLYAQRADLPLPPASMAKMMTELMVMDAVSSGRHDWNETVPVSRYAEKAPGSQVGMKSGETYTLREMFEALIIHSANDAAIAIAEHLAGSEREFVDSMNRRAREIGLSGRTVFANASGLTAKDLSGFPEAASEGETVMTARDAAMLARWLLQNYPDVVEVTSKRDLSIPQKGISLHTTNLMLPGEPYAYDGSDGFKTGYTRSAGYCFTGTAARDGVRLISVVLGTGHAEQRFTETQKLMDYGFRRQNAILGLFSIHI